MKLLGDLISIIKGEKSFQVYSTPIEGSMRYIQIEDLRSDIVLKYAVSNTGPIAQKSDLLIAWDGANAGTVGYGLVGYVGSTIAILRPKLEFHTPFLGLFLQSKFSDIQSHCTGATIPHVNKDHLLSLEIPLPPLEEQRRIADLLARADRLRRLRRHALQLSNTLLQSVFLDMFGDCIINDKHWKIDLLENLSILIDYGVSVPSNSNPVGPKLLRITDIQDGAVDWDTVPYCSTTGKDKDDHLLQVGDIVFARTGATTGKSFLIQWCPPNSIFASYLIRVRPGKSLNPIFLFGYFQSPGYWKQITESASGSAQPGVNSTKLGQLKIPVPTISIQEKYASMFTMVTQLRNRQIASMIQAEQLCQTLLQRAFAG